MKVALPTREHAIDCVDVLNDLVADCVAGVMVWREYHARFRAKVFNLQQMVAVQKMCISNIVLGLCKYTEFYERSKTVIPATHVDACKDLCRIVRQKGIDDFRNKIVGHIWDKDQGRPLRQSEIRQRLEAIIGPDMDAFLRWIDDPNGNVFPKTVTSIVETTRNAIMSAYGIT